MNKRTSVRRIMDTASKGLVVGGVLISASGMSYGIAEATGNQMAAKICGGLFFSSWAATAIGAMVMFGIVAPCKLVMENRSAPKQYKLDL